MAYLLLVTAFVVNGLASIFLKMNAVHAAPVKSLFSLETITNNLYLILALFLFATNVIFYYLALRTIPLSFAYPVMVTGSFLLLGFASTFFFREQVNMMQLLGYALVILGITLVSAFS